MKRVNKYYNQLKKNFSLLIIGFFLSCLVFVATTPLHEATHWVISEIDPYSEPVEFHLYDGKSFQDGQHILSSPLAYVTLREAYPGSFKDRPVWVDPLQELICISIQMILAYVIVSKTLTFLIK